jgi:hypothetical protein
VEDAAETGIADMAIAMAGNRDMRICVCAGGVTEGGGLRAGTISGSGNPMIKQEPTSLRAPRMLSGLCIPVALKI